MRVFMAGPILRPRGAKRPFPDFFAAAGGIAALSGPAPRPPPLGRPPELEATRAAPSAALAASGASAFVPGADGASLVLQVTEGRFAGAQVHLHFQPGAVSGCLRQQGRRIRRCRW